MLDPTPNNALVCVLTTPPPPPIQSLDSGNCVCCVEGREDEEITQPGHNESDKNQLLVCELAMRLAKAGMTDPHMETNVEALLSATMQQLLAAFDGHPARNDIIQAVTEIQQREENNLNYVDPNDNWFTRNITRFGKGFDMNDLATDTNKLVRKFDRLSAHYDHWAVGNRSKVERFIVQCARSNTLFQLHDATTRVLDIACGIGLQGQILRMCGYKGHLVGIDISPGMIERTVARGCYNNALVGNAYEAFHFSNLQQQQQHDDDLFDVVVCTGAMELLVPHEQRALENFASVLKPDVGQLWVSFQLDNSSSTAVDTDTKNNVKRRSGEHICTVDHCGSTTHQNVFGITEDKAVDLLQKAGFEVLTKEIVDDAFYTPSPLQNGTLLPVPYLFIVAGRRQS